MSKCPLCEEPKEVLPLDDVIRRYVLVVLARNNGSRVNTAKSLGVGQRTLGIWLKKWRDAGLMPKEPPRAGA